MSRVTDEKPGRSANIPYRALFDRLCRMFCLFEVKRDGGGRAVDFHFLAVNDEFERQMGLSEPELLGRSLFEFVPATGEPWLAAFEKASDQLDPVLIEVQSSRVGRWYEVLVYSPAEGLLAAMGVDIGASKEMKSSLEAGEERFRLAMEATSDGIWDRDVVSGQVYYSPAYYRMLGYDAEVFGKEGKAWLDLVHPEDRAAIESANEACVAGRLWSFDVEFRMRAKDGSWRWIESRGRAVSRGADGKATRIIGTHIDITERKRLEAEREALDADFRAVTELSPDHIFMQDADLRYTMVINPPLGLAESDMVGKTDHDFLPPDEAARLVAAKRDVLGEGRPLHFATALTDRSGGEACFDGSYIPRFDGSGKPCGLIGYFRDVTAERRDRARIEALVAEKDMILREMRHRTKNHLLTIRGYLTLRAGRCGNPEAKAALSDSIGLAAGMEVLFDRLYRSGDAEKLPARDYLPALVEEIVGVFGRTVPVRVEVEVGDFELDEKRLSTIGILVNELVTNSMKHAFEGVASPLIALRMDAADGKARIVYRDNGKGLSGAGDGGFGLTLVRSLAGQLRGALQVGEGPGAVFTVEFPL